MQENLCFIVNTVFMFGFRHVWVHGIVRDLCKRAAIENHTRIVISSIGGSRVIQHWNIPDVKNKAKDASRTGKVDVLALLPIFLPDAGIENFTSLAWNTTRVHA